MFGETSFGSYGKKRYRFCGKEKDEESGLYYYGMRYYSAWTCRFMSVDPLAGKYMHYSPYLYASNNPIGRKDILGMEDPKAKSSGGGKTQANNVGPDSPKGSVRAKGNWIHNKTGEKVTIGENEGASATSMREFGWVPQFEYEMLHNLRGSNMPSDRNVKDYKGEAEKRDEIVDNKIKAQIENSKTYLSADTRTETQRAEAAAEGEEMYNDLNFNWFEKHAPLMGAWRAGKYDKWGLTDQRNAELKSTLIEGGLIIAGGFGAGSTESVAGREVAAEVTATETAVVAEQSQVQLNREAGNIFRDEVAALLEAEGRQVETEVYKKTPFGRRFIDIEVSNEGKVMGGIETKVGNSPYTPQQRAKDMYLYIMYNYRVDVVRKPANW